MLKFIHIIFTLLIVLQITQIFISIREKASLVKKIIATRSQNIVNYA